MQVDERDIQAYLYAYAPRRDHLVARAQRAMKRRTRYREAHRTIDTALILVGMLMLAPFAAWLAWPQFKQIATLIGYCGTIAVWITMSMRIFIQVRVGQRLTRRWPAILARGLEREHFNPAVIEQLRAASRLGGLQSWLVLYDQPMIRRPLKDASRWFPSLGISPERLFLLTDRKSWTKYFCLMGFVVATAGVLAWYGPANRIGMVLFPCAFCGGWPVALVYFMWVARGARRRREFIAGLLMPRQAAVCGHCEYDLRGCQPMERAGLRVLRCPECGNEQRIPGIVPGPQAAEP